MAVIAQNTADSCLQFCGAEGLCDIVVGAHVKGLNLILFICPGGQYHNGGGVLAADPLDEYHAILIGKAEVQNNQIGMMGGK